MGARLYGLLHPAIVGQPLDPAIQGAIDAYVDDAVALQMENFHDDLLTPAEFEGRTRQTTRDLALEFFESNENGFKVIGDALVAKGLQRPSVPDENLEVFDDPEAFQAAINGGRQVYQLLGFTDENLEQFYRVLTELVTSRAYNEARDGLTFLITIKPDAPEFLTSLGNVQYNLQLYDRAQQHFEAAHQLSKTIKENYTGLINTYIMKGMKGEAKELCEWGIELADLNPAEPWAEELRAVLLDEKKSKNLE